MKKLLYRIFLVFMLTNFGFGQNNSIESLIKQTNELELDMWELTEFAQKHIKDKEKLSKFFYYWMGCNIKYDYEYLAKMDENFDDYDEKQDEFRIYVDRKGVCGGYANLFRWFMREVGIEVEYIIGHIRDERNHYVELQSDDDFLHAWNAIKLNGKWVLVDTTWGASNNIEEADFYFNIKPEWAIITHYPEDSKWQLLKEPLTLEKFNNSKFIKPVWFIKGFSEIPKLMADENFYYFVFKKNPNKDWLVGLQYSTDNINFNPIPKIESIAQKGYVYYKFDKSIIPKTTYFKVKIGQVKIIENQLFKNEIEDVINFKI